jgi:hyperosmotically inducible periplasmic protein
MKAMSLAIAATLALAVAPVSTWALGGTDGSAQPQFVKDSRITGTIRTELSNDRLTSGARIRVDSDANGVVYLSGTAGSQQAIDQAVMVAWSARHVTAVKNSLSVQPAQ